MLVDCKARINFLRHKITDSGVCFGDLFPQMMIFVTTSVLSPESFLDG